MAIRLEPLSNAGFGSNMQKINLPTTIADAVVMVEFKDEKPKKVVKDYKDTQGDVVFTEEMLVADRKPPKNETRSLEEQALEGSLDFYNQMYRVKQTATFSSENVQKKTSIDYSTPTSGSYYYSPRAPSYYNEVITGKQGDTEFTQKTSRVLANDKLVSQEYQGKDSSGNITEVKRYWNPHSGEPTSREQKFNGALHGEQNDREGNPTYFWHGEPISPLMYNVKHMKENGLNATFFDRTAPAQEAAKRLPEQANTSPVFWNKRVQLN